MFRKLKEVNQTLLIGRICYSEAPGGILVIFYSLRQPTDEIIVGNFNNTKHELCDIDIKKARKTVHTRLAE